MTKPTIGQSNWGEALNAELDRLDVTNPASAAAVSLSATIAGAVATAPNGDATRAARDTAYRAWNSQLQTAATPRALIRGHSVVAGTGASDQPHCFAKIVKAGIELLHPSAVVTIDGHGGYTTAALLALGAPGVLSSPHGLIVYMTMLNDYQTGVAPATTKANLQALIAQDKAANGSPSPSFLIVAEYLRGDVTSPAYPWSQYLAAAKEVAAADPAVTVLDVSNRLGNADPDPFDLFDPDKAHPNDAGHALLGRLVLADILATEGQGRPLPTHVSINPGAAPTAQTGWTGITRDTSSTQLLRYSDAAQNSSITYEFLGAPGTYTIALDHRQQTNGGKYDLYIDGVLQGAGGTWDGYAAVNTDAYSAVAGFTIAKSGVHTLQLKMASKNASSSDYAGIIRGIHITRTGA